MTAPNAMQPTLLISLRNMHQTLIIVALMFDSFLANATVLNGGVTPDNLAVVVNDSDANSVEVGNYYMSARSVPSENLIHVNLPTNLNKLSPEAFEPIRRQILASLPEKIQAILLVWTTPYAVGCNSITSALTFGYDAKQCEKSCGPGSLSPYFDSNSSSPKSDLGIRLTMLLPSNDVEEAKALIDRGLLSTFKRNLPATGFFLLTTDKTRSSRASFFPKSGYIESKHLNLETLEANTIENKKDVMFYFTGLTHVTNLNTLNFLPGAIADHLTSTGGDLLGKSQMSILAWIRAGATGSYGTVSEPCNYWQKFPNPMVVLKHYLTGETLIESYWKSVAWPAQGLFVGEPLARPYE